MKTAIITALCVIIVSCATLKKTEPIAGQITLTKYNVSKIDGVYDVVVNNTAPVSLDLALTFKKYWWRDFDRMHDYSLQIKTIDSCHLQTSIFRVDELIDQKTIKFKIIDGNLLISKTKLSPFYFIINFFGDMKTRVTLLPSDNLLIDHDNFQMAVLIIIPLTGDRARCNRLEFPRRTASR